MENAVRVGTGVDDDKKALAFDRGATAPRSNDFATAVTMITKTLAFDRGAAAPRSNYFATAVTMITKKP